MNKKTKDQLISLTNDKVTAKMLLDGDSLQSFIRELRFNIGHDPMQINKEEVENIIKERILKFESINR